MSSLRQLMSLAVEVSTAATCDRKHVGCVIADERHEVISVGYNTSPGDARTCDQVGHLMVGNNCVRTVHAEVMAVAAASRHGSVLSIPGAVAVVTALPCFNCLKLLYAVGIREVRYTGQHDALAWGWPVSPDDDVAVGLLFPRLNVWRMDP